MKKLIFLTLIATIITGCLRSQQIEEHNQESIQQEQSKVLSVQEAVVEKQIAQLGFCEAVFKTEFFHIEKQESLIHGRECNILWNMKEQNILDSLGNNPKLAKKFASKVKASRQKAIDNNWLEESLEFYLLAIDYEASALSLKEKCELRFYDGGPINYNKVGQA